MRESGGIKEIGMVMGIVAVVTILIGGYASAPGYGKEKTTFETPFETSTVPACSGEEVAIRGVAKFVFTEKTDKDGNIQQKATMSYHAKAVGMTSGTQYIVHEKEVQTFEQVGGESTFGSVIKGKFNGKGSEPNTHVQIRLVTVIHANGEAETLVDDVSVKCN